MYYLYSEQHTDEVESLEAATGKTVTLMAELPEEGIDVTWLKDNVPLSMSDGKYETINKDTSYELVIPDGTMEDGGEYMLQGGDY